MTVVLFFVRVTLWDLTLCYGLHFTLTSLNTALQRLIYHSVFYCLYVSLTLACSSHVVAYAQGCDLEVAICAGASGNRAASRLWLRRN